MKTTTDLTTQSPRLSRRLFLMALAVLSVSTTSPAETTPPADIFAGLWAITATPDNPTAQRGVQTFEDKLLFEESKLTAEACAKYGLAPSPYALTISSTSGRTYFTSEMKSDTQGTMTWTGTVSSSSLRGKLVWIKMDGSTNTYRLKGSRTQVVQEVIQPDVEPTEPNP